MPICLALVSRGKYLYPFSCVNPLRYHGRESMLVNQALERQLDLNSHSHSGWQKYMERLLTWSQQSRPPGALWFPSREFLRSLQSSCMLYLPLEDMSLRPCSIESGAQRGAGMLISTHPGHFLFTFLAPTWDHPHIQNSRLQNSYVPWNFRITWE